jgi:S-DNA-T family DNA segregation ATPase FtsK/SpoIIIE
MEGYQFPGLDLLEAPEENFSEVLEGMVREQAQALEGALRQYRIDGEVVGIESGPVITLYDVRLAPGTKVAQLNAIDSDIARSLKAVNIRIVRNQAGRDTVGIEVPNPTKERVRLKELMSNSEAFAKMKLPMFLGKDASGEPLIADLTQMPHMLIAGTTGSGKSVCMNTIIMSFLYTKKPNELKLVLVDPKMVEMSQFKDIPHLMCPVVTEMAKAAAILEWACKKMDERYELLAEAGCRDIASYNELTWDELKSALNPTTPEEEARIPRKLPYMVFIIDELADLMMTNKEVEGSIIRIAQKARAVGIHLILATQRPQANVVTGLIKSNMPCRISFKVASGMDSRIVLDQKGGELLLGQGDMLYLSPRTSKLVRSQGTLVDDKEIRRVVRFMRDIATPTFERQLMQLRSGGTDEERLVESENNSSASLAAAQEDPMFDRAVEIVLESKRGSVSLLQRRLAIGYTRSSRLIDLMGIAGIISDHKGSVARDVIITQAEWDAMKALAAEAGQQGQLFGDEAEMKPRPVEPPSLDGFDEGPDDVEEEAMDFSDDDEGEDDHPGELAPWEEAGEGDDEDRL